MDSVPEFRDESKQERDGRLLKLNEIQCYDTSVSRNKYHVHHDRLNKFIKDVKEGGDSKSIHRDLREFQLSKKFNEHEIVIREKFDGIPQEIIELIVLFVGNHMIMSLIKNKRTVIQHDYVIKREIIDKIKTRLMTKWNNPANHQLMLVNDQKMVILKNELVEFFGQTIVLINHDTGAEFQLTMAFSLGAPARLIDPSVGYTYPCTENFHIKDPTKLFKVHPSVICTTAYIINNYPTNNISQAMSRQQQTMNGVLRFTMGDGYAAHSYSSCYSPSFQVEHQTLYKRELLRDGVGNNILGKDLTKEMVQDVPVKVTILNVPTLRFYRPKDNVLTVTKIVTDKTVELRRIQKRKITGQYDDEYTMSLNCKAGIIVEGRSMRSLKEYERYGNAPFMRIKDYHQSTTMAQWRWTSQYAYSQLMIDSTNTFRTDTWSVLEEIECKMEEVPFLDNPPSPSIEMMQDNAFNNPMDTISFRPIYDDQQYDPDPEPTPSIQEPQNTSPDIVPPLISTEISPFPLRSPTTQDNNLKIRENISFTFQVEEEERSADNNDDEYFDNLFNETEGDMDLHLEEAAQDSNCSEENEKMYYDKVFEELEQGFNFKLKDHVPGSDDEQRGLNHWNQVKDIFGITGSDNSQLIEKEENSINKNGNTGYRNNRENMSEASENEDSDMESQDDDLVNDNNKRVRGKMGKQEWVNPKQNKRHKS